MKKTLVLTVFIIAAGIVLGGCGGGSSSNGCLKNPWLSSCSNGTAASLSITASVLVPGSLTLSREAGRDAALTSTQPLSGASVGLYTMGTDGTLTAVSGVTPGTTNTSGTFTISGVTAGTNYVLKATRTISSTTYFVYGIVSVTAAQYGTTVTASNLTTETTFAVAGLAQIVNTYNTGLAAGSQKALSAFSESDVSSLTGLINSNLQTQVTASNVSLTNVHTSATALSTEFGNLRTSVSSIDTLATSMSTPPVNDTTAPTGPTYVYDGLTADVDTTTSTTQLSANWDAATDAESSISAYYYSIGTSSGASDTVSWTSAGTGTSVTKTALTLSAGTTYYVSVKAMNGAGLFGSKVTSDGIQVQAGDTTAPTVSSFSPANGATSVSVNSPVFKVVFSEAMDNTVDLNNQTTLTASGFSLTLQRADTGGSITINTTNALSYGSFSWTTTTTTNDSLSFTLKTNAQLTTAGLKVLLPGVTYNITARTVPTNLKDVAANALSATGIASTGSFTTSADATAPTVTSMSPADGEAGVIYDGTTFMVIFDETMDASVSLNDQATLTASGFSISLQRSDTGGTLTIDTTNALSYGSFYWASTYVLSDTLAFQLKDNATLTGLGLKTLSAYSTYTITAYTVPSNITDFAGNVVNTAGAPTTGSFSTRQ